MPTVSRLVLTQLIIMLLLPNIIIDDDHALVNRSRTRSTEKRGNVYHDYAMVASPTRVSTRDAHASRMYALIGKLLTFHYDCLYASCII